MDKSTKVSTKIKPESRKKTRFCVSCRNHNIKSPVTGHKNACQFSSCECVLCKLTNHVKFVSLKERKNQRVIKTTQNQQKEISELDKIKIEPNKSENFAFSDTQCNAELITDDSLNEYIFFTPEPEEDLCTIFESGEPQQFLAQTYTEDADFSDLVDFLNL